MLNVELIVPIYEEEESIKVFIDELEKISLPSKVNLNLTFIMDPGNDNSENLLRQLIEEKKFKLRLKTIILDKRIGQANCIYVGLKLSSADAAIVIDVDLQDPVNLIPFMIEKWLDGYEVVLPRRVESKLKLHLIPSQIFYFMINLFSFNRIPKNVGDFRLLDKRVIESIIEQKPFKPFLRGDTDYLKYNSLIFDFKRKKREIGETRYSNNYMRFKVAFNALLNYSFFFQFQLIIIFGVFLVNEQYLKLKLNILKFDLVQLVLVFLFLVTILLILINHNFKKRKILNFRIEKILD